MSKEAREQALKFLVSRMRCEREVREHLRKKGHSRADIDDAVDYLYSYEYLDDLKYCEAFIHDRVQFNPCGRQKLFYDLSQKGVSRQRKRWIPFCLGKRSKRWLSVFGRKKRSRRPIRSRSSAT